MAEHRILRGKYLLGKEIGSGGMAIVYKANRLDTGEQVAVKILRQEYADDAQYVNQFRKEERIAIEHHHRNLVNTFDAGEDNGTLYIVMEYVQGQTLKQIIAERGKLSLEETVDIALQICDALYYAHSHKLVHRDIKPQNILVTPEGMVKVADFGIAKSSQNTTITMDGSQVMGSVHYISPEQARGSFVDAKSDLYSLGVVLFEMMTGRLPYTGDTAVSIALRHLQDPVPSAREIDPSVCRAMSAVIQKAMAKDPSVRYRNARELADDLIRTLKEPDGDFVKIIQFDDMATRGMPPVRGTTGSFTGPVEAVESEETPVASRRKGGERPQPHKKKRKTWLWILLAALAVLGAGLFAALALSGLMGTDTTVPEVVGQDVEAAQQALEARQLESRENYVYSTDVPINIVISSDPVPGTALRSGHTVTLTISKGPEEVQVPDVAGLTEQQATARLAERGLKLGTVKVETSDKAPGTVLRQQPAADETAKSGSTVDVWLSKAPETKFLTMRQVIGMEEEEAKSYLTSLGIKVGKVERVESDEYPAGLVVNQEPSEGTLLEADAEVVLYVSSGPKPVYHGSKLLTVTITEDNTLVEVKCIDTDGTHTLYQETLGVGEQQILVQATSTTRGAKSLIILFNGVEQFRETVDVTNGG